MKDPVRLVQNLIKGANHPAKGDQDRAIFVKKGADLITNEVGSVKIYLNGEKILFRRVVVRIGFLFGSLQEELPQFILFHLIALCRGACHKTGVGIVYQGILVVVIIVEDAGVLRLCNTVSIRSIMPVRKARLSKSLSNSSQMKLQKL